MNCTSCGATVRAGSGRFCSHCAAVLPGAPRITADEYRTHAERFEAVAAHPQYAHVVSSPPEVSAIAEIAIPVIMVAAGAGAGVCWPRIAAELENGLELPLLVGLLLWQALGLFLLFRGLAYRRAPVLSSIAVIVDERTEVSTSGTDKNRSTTTRYYATLQFRDGTRTEYAIGGRRAGLLAVGDAGVAFTKGDRLADFQRLAV